MVNRARREWFRIIRDLMAQGVSMHDIARRCGKTTKAVSNWADGGDPKETDARIVLSLYATFCPAKYREHQAQFEIRVAEEAKPVDQSAG